MYTTISDYADLYEPLSLEEEVPLYRLPYEAMFLKVVQHNARMIVKLVIQWDDTYDSRDDAVSVALIGVRNCINNHIKHDKAGKYKLGASCYLYIRAALHRYAKKNSTIVGRNELLPDLNEIDESDSDLMDWVVEILGDDVSKLLLGYVISGESFKELEARYGITCVKERVSEALELLRREYYA